MPSDEGTSVASVSWDIEAVQYNILSEDDHQDREGESSLLMIASEYGNVNVVKSLLEHNDMQDINGVSTLMLASHNGHIDVVKVLLEYNAQVDLQHSNGQSSLMAASYEGHVDVVKVLLESDAQVDLQSRLWGIFFNAR